MTSEFFTAHLQSIATCQAYLKALLCDAHQVADQCFLDGVVNCLKAHPIIAQEITDRLAISNTDELLQLIGNSETATLEMISCVMSKFGLTLRIKLV